MKRSASTIYAAVCTLLLAAGFLLTFFFAQRAGIDEMIGCLCGLAVGFVLSPIAHELGHICFAGATGMRVAYAKFFCFKIYEKNGKMRLGFASPFTADQTQAVPLRGGNMKKRACAYTLGGIIFGGAFLSIVLAAAITLACFGIYKFKLWGVVPYAAYLVLLNAMPCRYASGKTDMLVYIGLKKGEDAERTMLAAMEIQGRLAEGKRFSEIDESLYFDLPQLPEDEPLFAVMLDLRYRYFLDKGEIENAADCLNRLVGAQEYLAEEESEKLAAELVYMHSVRGDRGGAEQSGKYAREFLSGDTATAKRVLVAYTLAFGGEDKREKAEILLAQAELALEKERIEGVKKLESELLARLA